MRVYTAEFGNRQEEVGPEEIGAAGQSAPASTSYVDEKVSTVAGAVSALAGVVKAISSAVSMKQTLQSALAAVDVRLEELGPTNEEES